MHPPPIEDDLEEEQEALLPPNGLISSIIIGSIGGIIALAVPIAIVLINASLFREASHLDPNTPPNQAAIQVANSVLAWQCSSAFVDLLIAFIVGMIVGKIAVKRKLGFLAGVLVGGIVFLGTFFAHYIPGYPDIISGSATTSTTGMALVALLTTMIPLVIYALAGGLMSLWGTRITTRRHPYYYEEAADADRD
jgi:hypothetical protein